MQTIKYLLLPVSLLYGIIMEIRNLFYEFSIFKSYHFDIPVISVGNITVGGTGKTPFVIWLAKKMLGHYNKIAVISRGYGRSSKGMKVVSDYKNPQKFGDEPCLIAVSVPEVVVIVSENRKKAIEHAVEEYDADLIILDDAFQHRSVQRNLDMVLLNSAEKYNGNFPLPTGTLREFKHNISRSDIIIITNTTEDDAGEINIADKSLYRSRGILNTIVNSDFAEIESISNFKDRNVVAFSGIAHPEIFKKYLEQKEIKVKKYLSFRDHYNYTIEDIKTLIHTAQSVNCQILLCTEKDMIKISAIKGLSNDETAFFYAPKLELKIEDEKKLLKKLSHILTW